MILSESGRRAARLCFTAQVVSALTSKAILGRRLRASRKISVFMLNKKLQAENFVEYFEGAGEKNLGSHIYGM